MQSIKSQTVHMPARAHRMRGSEYSRKPLINIFLNFKIDKTWHNFFISGPIVVIKVPLFSVFNTQCHGIKIPHIIFKDLLTK